MQAGGHLQGLHVPFFQFQYGLQAFFQYRLGTFCIGCDGFVNGHIGIGLVEAVLLIAVQIAQTDQLFGNLCRTCALIDPV